MDSYFFHFRGLAMLIFWQQESSFPSRSCTPDTPICSPCLCGIACACTVGNERHLARASIYDKVYSTDLELLVSLLSQRLYRSGKHRIPIFILHPVSEARGIIQDLA